MFFYLCDRRPQIRVLVTSRKKHTFSNKCISFEAMRGWRNCFGVIALIAKLSFTWFAKQPWVGASAPSSGWPYVQWPVPHWMGVRRTWDDALIYSPNAQSVEARRHWAKEKLTRVCCAHDWASPFAWDDRSAGAHTSRRLDCGAPPVPTAPRRWGIVPIRPLSDRRAVVSAAPLEPRLSPSPCSPSLCASWCRSRPYDKEFGLNTMFKTEHFPPLN